MSSRAGGSSHSDQRTKLLASRLNGLGHLAGTKMPINVGIIDASRVASTLAALAASMLLHSADDYDHVRLIVKNVCLSRYTSSGGALGAASYTLFHLGTSSTPFSFSELTTASTVGFSSICPISNNHRRFAQLSGEFSPSCPEHPDQRHKYRPSTGAVVHGPSELQSLCHPSTWCCAAKIPIGPCLYTYAV